MSTPRPGLFVILLDRSYSMEETIARVDPATLQFAKDVEMIPDGQSSVERRQMLTLLVNEALMQILEAARDRTANRLKERFRITVRSFAEDCVETVSVMGQPMVNLRPQDLEECCEVKMITVGKGKEGKKVQTGWWFDPLEFTNARQTNYLEALSAAKRDVDEFIAERDGDAYYAPQVIMLTDGENNGPPAWKDIATELASKAVLWLIHVSDGAPLCGADPSAAGLTGEVYQDLYENCSLMPDPFIVANQSIHAFDPKRVDKPACCAVNCTPFNLRRMLQLIKTGTLKTAKE